MVLHIKSCIENKQIQRPEIPEKTPRDQRTLEDISAAGRTSPSRDLDATACTECLQLTKAFWCYRPGFGIAEKESTFFPQCFELAVIFLSTDVIIPHLGIGKKEKGRKGRLFQRELEVESVQAHKCQARSRQEKVHPHKCPSLFLPQIVRVIFIRDPLVVAIDHPLQPFL